MTRLTPAQAAQQKNRTQTGRYKEKTREIPMATLGLTTNKGYRLTPEQEARVNRLRPLMENGPDYSRAAKDGYAALMWSEDWISAEYIIGGMEGKTLAQIKADLDTATREPDRGQDTWVPCNTCEGTGTITRVGVDRDGEPYPYPEQCGDCYGTGFAVIGWCSVCGGRGEVSWDYDDPESQSTVKPQAECPACGGTGYERILQKQTERTAHGR